MKTSISLYETLCRETTLYEAWKVVNNKKATGGIDGMTLSFFEEKLQENISELVNELKAGTWKPEPYYRIEIPKKKNEFRQLGLLSIKDKIVQQAIKALVEPYFENLFINNSYGYRPNKGHTKAIRRVQSECTKKKNKWVLRLDIDNYFDSIDHDLLAARIHSIIPDEEIVRLIMLSVQMGIVNKRLKWQDIEAGVPQGAILSPLLSNLYLHVFDKFVLSQNCSYVRYADDFIILCETLEQARLLLQRTTTFLQSNLKLKLNTPILMEIWKGFEFLGITITKTGLTLSEKKKQELKERIIKLEITPKGFTTTSIQSWNGVRNYYIYY